MTWLPPSVTAVTCAGSHLCLADPWGGVSIDLGAPHAWLSAVAMAWERYLELGAGR